MSADPSPRLDDLPPTLVARLDRICDRFESAGRAGRRPRIEDFLGEIPEPERPALLRELLLLELELRRTQGERPTAAEYRARFPSDGALIDDVFREAPEPIPDPDPNGHLLGGRYQLLGEIAKGGMGAVLRGHDTALGRDLAVKVLLEEHKGDPELARRFLEEARIASQLQHPGVPPVHDLGALPDGRPFFAMKLVKGQTLEELLKRRVGPAEDLPRFLAVFEQVCQTIAYAHARGVIHRDLKPSNVMVGSFGEVQVMDWGLAKPLADGPATDRVPLGGTVIRSAPPDTPRSPSHAGTVLGTPAYMAPEQANGEVDRVDERADVFGLGAILCEILTGKPPYEGRDRGEVLHKAWRADLKDALARLGACGADAELVALAKACLAAEPEDRPRDARAVAAAMTTYLNGVQERLRRAELAQAESQARAEEEVKRRALADQLAREAQARAVEERRRRRTAVGLAAAVVALVVTAAGGWFWQERQLLERALHVDRSLGEVTSLKRKAEESVDDPARWSAAREAARQLNAMTPDARDAVTRVRIAAVVRAVEEASAAAERDRVLVGRLIDIRSGKVDDPDGSATDADYADAFRTAGIDVDVLDAAEVGTRVRRHPETVARALVAALDDWTAVRRGRGPERKTWARLVAAAQAADPDPTRDGLRDALLVGDEGQRLGRLSPLADRADAEAWEPASLVLLANGLAGAGDVAAGAEVLRRAAGAHPEDVWVHYELGQLLERVRPPQTEEAIRAYTAARALRPETAHMLAHALEDCGRGEEAGAVFRDLTRRRPEVAGHLDCYGTFLKEHDRGDESDAVLDRAIAAGRAALRLRPDDARAHNGLGLALVHKGLLDEAIAELHAALRLRPDFTGAHFNLGNALRDKRRLDEAIAEFRTALRLTPDDAKAHNNLGLALRDKRLLDEAIAEFHEALRLRPDDAKAHLNLGLALRDKGHLDEAIAEFHAALRLKPDYADAHNNLGNSLYDKRRLDEAIAEYRAALRLRPDNAGAHSNLGVALNNTGLPDEAIAEFRMALRLRPELADAHNNLGLALRDKRRLDEAIAEFHAALRLKPDYADAHNSLGLALGEKGHLDEAFAEFHAALRLEPNDASAHYNLGNTLLEKRRLDEAIAEYRAALRLKPDYAEAHSNLGNALRDKNLLDEAIAEFHAALRLRPDLAPAHKNLGDALKAARRLDEAIAEYRAALRFKPNYSGAHFNLGNTLKAAGRLDEAIAEYREALRLEPDFAGAHCNLGLALRSTGHYAEALEHLRKGHDLGSQRPDWRYPSAEWVRQAERDVALEARLSAVLKGDDRPKDAPEALDLAWMAYSKALHAAAARLYAEALQAEPRLADNLQRQHRYNAACAAALAGCGQRKDDPYPDDAAKAEHRAQARDWLKADLAAWSRLVESGPPQARAFVQQTLQHWKIDPDLAGLRAEAEVAKLSKDERKACRALWAEVEALLRRTSGETRPGQPPGGELPENPFAP